MLRLFNTKSCFCMHQHTLLERQDSLNALYISMHQSPGNPLMRDGQQAAAEAQAGTDKGCALSSGLGIVLARW